MADIGFELGAFEDHEAVFLGQGGVLDGGVEATVFGEDETIDPEAALAAADEPLEVAFDSATGIIGGVG